MRRLALLLVAVLACAATPVAPPTSVEVSIEAYMDTSLVGVMTIQHVSSASITVRSGERACLRYTPPDNVALDTLSLTLSAFGQSYNGLFVWDPVTRPDVQFIAYASVPGEPRVIYTFPPQPCV